MEIRRGRDSGKETSGRGLEELKGVSERRGGERDRKNGKSLTHRVKGGGLT